MPGDITSEFTHGEFDRAPDPLPVGNITAPGFSDVGARGDHQHKYGRQYGGTVTRTTPYSVASNAVGVVPWEIRNRDPEGFLPGSAPATDLKVPVGCAGRYLMSLQLYGTPGTSPNIRMFLQILTSVGTGQGLRCPFEPGMIGAVSGLINLAEGDTFQANVYQNSTATLTWTGYFDWVRIGPST
jgi:hypothetical protein